MRFSIKKILIAFCLIFTFYVPLICVTGPVCAVEAATVASPVPSAKSGTFYVNSYKNISLKCSTKDANIYYSTNGKDFKKYTKKIKLTGTTTLYAYAEKNGVRSDTVEYSYKLKVRLSGITPDAGKYDSGIVVKINTEAENVKIYYTTNGKKPTAKSSLYKESGIEINKNCTLRLLVKKSGFTNRYITKKYTIVNENPVDIIVTPNPSDQNSDSSGDNSSEGIPSSETPVEEYGSKFGYTDMSVFENRTFFNLLNTNEKALYSRMYDALIEHSDSVSVSDLLISDYQLHDVYYYMIAESPELFWVNDGAYSWSYNKYVSKVKFVYTNSASEQEKRQPLLEKKADEIIADAERNSENLFDFVKALHDYIATHSVYDLGNQTDRDTAGTDDIILDGHGLCTGYARAFMYLLQRSGINCIMVDGAADNGSGMNNHSWNKVLLDGDWYVFDMTWDDPIGSAADDVDYSYFAVTDKAISKDHAVADMYDLDVLKCTATKYNYYVYNNIEIYSDPQKACDALFEKAAVNLTEAVYKTSVVCDSYQTAMSTYDLAADKLKNTFTRYDRRRYFNGREVGIILSP